MMNTEKQTLGYSEKIQDLKKRVEALNYFKNHLDYDALLALTDELRTLMRPISRVEHIANVLGQRKVIERRQFRSISNDEKFAIFSNKKQTVLEIVAELELLLDELKS